MNDRYTAEELSLWSGGEWSSAAPRRIAGFSKDTRTLTKNDMYVAIRGENYDGHDFAADAVGKGASALLIDKDHADALKRSADCADCPQLIVPDTRLALKDLACAYRDKVDLDVIGITGSAGKSTVKEMTAQILKSRYVTSSTVGNWNNDIGLPMSLLQMDPASEKGVFEVGTNHPGEISALSSIIRPDWATVTNVGPVHIEHFDSVDSIALEKSELLRSLSRDGTAVLDADGKYFDFLKDAVEGNVITVSGGNHADYTYVVISQTGKVLVKESSTGEEMLFRPVVPGSHNIINALMAIAIVRGQGLEWEKIRTGLEHYKPLPMRWAEVKMGEITMINDAYNANPLSMRASIGAFEEKPVEGRKWLVLAGMGELGRMEKSEHTQLGEYVGEGNWGGVVLVGGCGEMIARGMQATAYDPGRIYLCVNNHEAAEVLEHNIDNGDAVFLKASRDMRLEEVVHTVQTHLE